MLDRERRLRSALDRLGEQPDDDAADSPGAITAVSRRLEEIHAQARRQATRIRLKALQDAVQVSERVAELTRIRDDLGSRLLDLVEGASKRLNGSGEDAAEAAERLAKALDGEGREANGDGIFEGPVEVEVGPLDDFAQLSGFEDAAAKIGGADEIKVRNFSKKRATVAMNLGEPVELLRELEENSPFEFKVRDLRRDRLVLDVDDEPAEAA